jgi:type I restriction enzyme, S subunit
MSTSPLHAIGDLMEPVASWVPERVDPDGEFKYVDLSAVDQDSKSIAEVRAVACAEAPSRARQVIRSGDVLVSTVRPNLNGVAHVPPELDGATASTGFCVLRSRSRQLDSRYLFQWVKSPSFVDEMVLRATGASYPAVSDRIVCESKLPLPPLSEQRRIAEILDKADALRAKRRAARAQLDTFTQSIFLDMFGDPATNPKGWPQRTLASLLTMPLRNGLSPSKAGKVSAKVLTLSSVTGDAFDEAALKVSTFASRPPSEQSVDSSDFLICRGDLAKLFASLQHHAFRGEL